jgi:hypothetical protein
VPKTKIAIRQEFRNRSQAIEAMLAEKLARGRRPRLARECSKLDPKQEKALAEEGFAQTSSL